MVSSHSVSNLVDREGKHRKEHMRVATFFERALAERNAGKIIEFVRVRDHLKVLDRLRYTKEIRPHDFGGPMLSRCLEIDAAHGGDQFLEQSSVVSELGPELSSCSGLTTGDNC